MHVLVNALSATIGGGLTSLKRLVPALLDEDAGEHDYTVLTRSDGSVDIGPDHPRLRRISVSLRGRSFERAIQEQGIVPAVALLRRADVLLSPAGLASFACPVPQVLVFRNAAPFTSAVVEQYRHTANARRMPTLRRMGILSAKVCRRVVFISDGQRDLILPQLGIPASRTARVYLGRSPEFTPTAAERAGPTLERLGIRQPYVLSVSHFYRYQNLVELVQGFAKARLPSDVQLVLAGPELEADYAARVHAAATEAGISERTRFVGSVPYSELAPLYGAAEIFVFSTTCESFPNTLIEAMASGAATLSSHSQPMPELAGDGAEFCDANSPTDLGEKLRSLWNDVDGRQNLRRKGAKRALTFAWNLTAKGLLSELDVAVR